MFHHMCLVCNDPHSYNNKVNDAKRIGAYLNKYVSKKLNIEDRRLWSSLSMDRQHYHVMCGACPKINKTELNNAEEKIRVAVYCLCKQLENGEDLPVHNILRMLQGYYPVMWKEIHRRAIK